MSAASAPTDSDGLATVTLTAHVWDAQFEVRALHADCPEGVSVHIEVDGGQLAFTAIGDTHAGIQGAPNYHDWANHNHGEAVAEMLRLDRDFYLHLGDMVHEPTALAWNEFFTIEEPILSVSPIYPTIGNHEAYHENHSYYARFSQLSHLASLLHEDQPWYSYDWENAHFVSLWIDFDEHTPEGEDCAPGSPQHAWLETDLASVTKPWLIVFFHVAIYSSTAELSPARMGLRAALHPLFVDHGVDLVLAGHDHYYERVEVDGITYIESGGGDNRRPPDDPIPESVFSTDRNHIVHVTIDQGTLSGAAISSHAVGNNWETSGGEVLDQFTVTKP